MEKTTKLTNVIALTNAIATLSAIDGYNADELAKLNNIKASFEKKSGTAKKPTPNQIENEKIKARIVDILDNEPARLFTATEICDALAPDKYSVSKVSNLCKQLREAELIVRTESKGRAYFSHKA